MNVRPFDWRDLPILLRYRHRGLFFDNTLVLTRGRVMVPARAMLSYLASAAGVFTYLCFEQSEKDSPLLGQVSHVPGSEFARLTFLAPETALESGALPLLLEQMIAEVGGRGAFHLLAEVDERSVAFDALRRASFAIYVRQRIWQLSGEPVGEAEITPWEPGAERDALPVRSLYNNLVPGLVQQVEPPPTAQLRGLVYRQGDDLLAYIELKYGARGIWVHPFIHPNAELIPARLVDLLKNLPYRRSRPVYVCVRSYQSWLEPALEGMGALAGPVQVVMVKHLAIAKRVGVSYALPALEGKQPEVTAPIVRSESKH